MKLWSEIIAPEANGKNSAGSPAKSAIVFLHGTGSNARMWKNQIPFFTRRGHTCILIDLRGHGSSSEPYEKTDLETHIQDILQTLEGKQIQFPAHFVGHSLGAIIALSLAEKKPQLVKSIYAACLPRKLIKPVKKSMQLFINGSLEALKQSKIKRHLGWREQTLIEMSPFTLKEIFNYFTDLDLLNRLPQIRCPLHLSCGRFDPIATYWHSQHLHKQFPGSTLKIFEWAGHNFMDASPDAFNTWMAQYLKD